MEKENEEIPSPIQPVNSPNSIESFLEKLKSLSLFVTVGLMVLQFSTFTRPTETTKQLSAAKSLFPLPWETLQLARCLNLLKKIREPLAEITPS